MSTACALFSIVYSFIDIVNQKMYVGTSQSAYYFGFFDRSCAYFIGCSVALASLKSPKPQQPKPEIKVETNLQHNQQFTDLQTKLNYQVKPEKTSNAVKNKEIKQSKNMRCVYIVGFISLVVIIASFVTMNRYFQMGNDSKPYGIYVSALQTVFGKIFFVSSVMILLIVLCRYFENFPKAIANNAVIQLIGNLSFSMYGWHYIML